MTKWWMGGVEKKETEAKEVRPSCLIKRAPLPMPAILRFSKVTGP